MKKLIADLLLVCDVYIRESERGIKTMKGSQYWTGYHRGQKNLAEDIKRILEEAR